MKYTTKELGKGILSIQLFPENDIESKILKSGDTNDDDIIEIFYQDAVSKYNSNYELLQVIDIVNWPNAAVVKYEIVKGI